MNDSDTKTSPANQCDVLVIGGGPGGSTVAALLARRGWSVMQLEKDHHPRFHIGESLLPMNLPVLERLGVLDQVRALGVYKPGADFEADNKRGYNTYAFARALGNSPPHAFQVWRQDFDRMLFEHARTQGVDAREGAEVIAVQQYGPRDSSVEVRSDAAGSYTLRARYVVDASGRDAFLASRKQLRRKNPRHQSAAIFGHFRDATYRGGEDRGNISIYNFAHGWMWMIPLPDGVMSVGAVCRPDYLKSRRTSPHDFFFATLKLHPALWARLEKATLIGDQVRVTGNYSYDASSIGGPGWMLVGDAFAFLDPVFSSGVYLAMSGAEQSAKLIDAALREPAREVALQRRLEKRLRTGMQRFAFFIYRFNSPPMQHIFQHPRNVWQVEQGVISMLAGDLFDSRKVWWRLQFFRLIYFGTVLRNFRRWHSEHRYRLAQAKTEFTGGTTPVDPA
ncbi:MAG: tryptophan 7-halogenase [Gammaproteobacteria bacterium]|nr:tryptophan 7-halogenase [Gammaproteobacteria bacterium]MDE1983222.1 tryptophan 7-halogenase [Gammaproteobacteria bacterium]MDE2459777.1 tryptophan 7-halogenase [Gammaproteobacteria bacterium]